MEWSESGSVLKWDNSWGEGRGDEAESFKEEEYMLTVQQLFSNSFEGVEWGVKKVRYIVDTFCEYQCKSYIVDTFCEYQCKSYINEEFPELVHVVAEFPEFAVDIVVWVTMHVIVVV